MYDPNNPSARIRNRGASIRQHRGRGASRRRHRVTHNPLRDNHGGRVPLPAPPSLVWDNPRKFTLYFPNIDGAIDIEHHDLLVRKPEYNVDYVMINPIGTYGTASPDFCRKEGLQRYKTVNLLMIFNLIKYIENNKFNDLKDGFITKLYNKKNLINKSFDIDIEDKWVRFGCCRYMLLINDNIEFTVDMEKKFRSDNLTLINKKISELGKSLLQEQKVLLFCISYFNKNPSDCQILYYIYKNIQTNKNNFIIKSVSDKTVNKIILNLHEKLTSCTTVPTTVDIFLQISFDLKDILDVFSKSLTSMDTLKIIDGSCSVIPNKKMDYTILNDFLYNHYLPPEEDLFITDKESIRLKQLFKFAQFHNIFQKTPPKKDNKHWLPLNEIGLYGKEIIRRREKIDEEVNDLLFEKRWTQGAEEIYTKPISDRDIEIEV